MHTRSALAASAAAAIALGTVVATNAAPASAATVIKFTDTTIRSHELGQDIFGSAGVDKNANGRVVGYSNATGTVDGDDVTLVGAFSRKGGLIFVRITFTGNDDSATGRIFGGTGNFNGAKGSITVENTSDTTSNVTLSVTTDDN